VLDSGGQDRLADRGDDGYLCHVLSLQFGEPGEDAAIVSAGHSSVEQFAGNTVPGRVALMRLFFAAAVIRFEEDAPRAFRVVLVAVSVGAATEAVQDEPDVRFLGQVHAQLSTT
jgi:hypothetical protein